jgi:hypothetical protein
LTVAAPMRMPVKEPGPAPTAKARYRPFHAQIRKKMVDKRQELFGMLELKIRKRFTVKLVFADYGSACSYR